uniref:Kazal-like domain-containing protein n=1 Tax=Naja naja TaxID=35670 RepID=A0A8C6VI58_NAJNA
SVPPSRHLQLSQFLSGCPRIYHPLCGTDNVTYPNICQFCKARKISGGCYFHRTDEKAPDNFNDQGFSKKMDFSEGDLILVLS